MGSLREFSKFAEGLPHTGMEMPVLFIGHGSPMNGIEDNAFSKSWAELGKQLPEPAAVLVVSAHWLTRGTKITAMEQPKTIHDFGGFPQALYQVQYPAPGNPQLAKETASLVEKTHIDLDHEWGLDHGAWTVVRHMFPKANIPVMQLSIDYSKGPLYHYELAKEIQSLRKKGVLIIGSGNLVHNLRMVAWDKLGDQEYGFDWAIEANNLFKTHIQKGDYHSLADYEKLGRAVQLAIPTPDHYLPLMYTLGVSSDRDEVKFFNDVAVGGSLTMTSVLLERA